MQTPWTRRHSMGAASLVLAGILTSAAMGAEDDRLIAKIPEGVTVAAKATQTTPAGDFEQRSSLVWSADGTQVAYSGRRGDEAVPVVGAEIGEAFDRVSRPAIVGGRAFFHVANSTSPSTQKHRIWVDGTKLKAEDWIGEFSVNAAGDRVAYWTHPGARYGNSEPAKSNEHYLNVAVLGKSGKWRSSRGEEYSSPTGSAPVWSADGAHVFSTGTTRKGSTVIRRGKREKSVSDAHDRIASLAVSADGSAIALVATGLNWERPELYFRGKRVAKRADFVARPSVSPAGDHVAYVFGTGEGVTVGVDGESSPPGSFGHVVSIAFSPDGSQLAFVAVVGGAVSERYPGLVEGGEWFVVERPTKLPRGEKKLIEHARHNAVRDLTWDTSGTRLAYAARGAGWRIVCGELQSEEFVDVGRPRFLPDRAAIGHGARVGRELWWKVLPLE